MRVDVIVVHYRRADDLLLLLSDLVSISSPEIGRIVVCDNSFDDVQFRPDLDGLANRPGAPELIHHPRSNDGYGSAVNDGYRILAADGRRPDFVFVATHDLRIRPDTVTLLADYASNNPSVGVVAPLLRDGRDGTSVWSSGGRLTPIRQSAEHFVQVPAGPVRRDWLDGSALLIRTSALEEVGLVAEAFFLYKEDVELCCRLRDAGWQVLNVPTAQAQQTPGGHDTTFLAVRNTFWLHIGNRRWIALALWLVENTARIVVGSIRPQRADRDRQRARLRAILAGLRPPPEIRARSSRARAMRVRS